MTVRFVFPGLLWCFAAVGLAASAPSDWVQGVSAGRAALRAGRYTEAEGIFSATLAALEAQGPEDDRCGAVLVQVGRLRMAESRHAEAAGLLEKAIALMEPRATGRRHELADAWQALGTACYYQRLYRKAEHAYGEALELRSTDGGAETVATGQILSSLGAIYQVESREADAQAALERARSFMEGAAHADARARVNVLNNIGALYRERGRAADAERVYREALEILESAGGRDQTFVVSVLNNLAVLYMDQKRYDDATATFEQMMSRMNGTILPRADLADLLANYSRCLRMAGKKAEARRLKLRAEALLKDKPGGSGEGMVVDVTQLRASR